MSNDLRIKLEFFNHVKTLKLQRRHGDSGVLALIRLWSYAGQHRTNGILHHLTHEDLAIITNYPGDIEEYIRSLCELRFLELENDVLIIHDWSDHQGWIVGSEYRKKKARDLALIRWGVPKEKNESLFDKDLMHDAMQDACRTHAERNAPSPTPTPIPSPNPNPSPIPASEIESGSNGSGTPKKRIKKVILDECFDAFWKTYPRHRRIARAAAYKIWQRLKPDTEQFELIMTALRRQCESRDWKKEQGKYVPKPVNWLRDERWLDESFDYGEVNTDDDRYNFS